VSPGPYLDIGDVEDDVVKFFKDLEALFRRNAVIDYRPRSITLHSRQKWIFSCMGWTQKTLIKRVIGDE
jgi:hypothetical protein